MDIASVTHDGTGTVTINLSEPLDYGRYILTVTGLLSVDGVAMTEDYNNMIVNTVPFYANETIKSVKAIGAQSGNPAANAIDGKLSTRWSQKGKMQWIQFDLGSVQYIYAVDLAWYLGNTRVNYFDIKCSTDGKTWTELDMDETSSGLTNEMERYTFDVTKARYVRIYCNCASTSEWNSMTEARVCVVDDTNGIVSETDDKLNDESAWVYDLAGRNISNYQVTSSQIMIKKGRKVFMKKK